MAMFVAFIMFIVAAVMFMVVMRVADVVVQGRCLYAMYFVVTLGTVVAVSWRCGRVRCGGLNS